MCVRRFERLHPAKPSCPTPGVNPSSVPCPGLYFLLKIGKAGWLNEMQLPTESTPALTSWTPDSWQTRPAAQQPVYPDPAALAPRAGASWPGCRRWSPVGKSRTSSTNWPRRRAASVSCCKAAIARRASRTANPSAIASKLKILLQMSLVLVQGGKKRVIRIGRFAGQYAKPRSADTETRGRRHAAQLPRRHDQPRRVHRRGADAQSGAAAARLRAVRAHDQFHPLADRRRLRRPAPPRILGAGFRGQFARTPPNTRAWSRASAIRCGSWRR